MRYPPYTITQSVFLGNLIDQTPPWTTYGFPEPFPPPKPHPQPSRVHRPRSIKVIKSLSGAVFLSFLNFFHIFLSFFFFITHTVPSSIHENQHNQGHNHANHHCRNQFHHPIHHRKIGKKHIHAVRSQLFVTLF
jgi:hypothetical protein